MNDKRKGFTLAELIVVIGIVGLLVAISIPIFNAQLERSRQATDLANMRSAKAAAVADWLNDGMRDGYSRYYDAGKGSMSDSIPDGYGKSTKDASLFASNLNATGVPFTGASRYILVNIDPLGIVRLSWGGNASYMNAVSPYLNQSLMDLHNMDNEKRKAADKATLIAIGEEILSKGWTLADLKKISIFQTGSSAYRIADYYQEKTGSFDSDYASAGFRISCQPGFQDILNAIGYQGSIQGDPQVSLTSVEQLNSGTMDYIYDNSLFYSDQLAANKYGDWETNPSYGIDRTRRMIMIDTIKCDSNGTIKSFRILTKAHQAADLTVPDKTYFEITIKQT